MCLCWPLAGLGQQLLAAAARKDERQLAESLASCLASGTPLTYSGLPALHVAALADWAPGVLALLRAGGRFLLPRAEMIWVAV